MAETLEV